MGLLISTVMIIKSGDKNIVCEAMKCDKEEKYIRIIYLYKYGKPYSLLVSTALVYDTKVASLSGMRELVKWCEDFDLKKHAESFSKN